MSNTLKIVERVRSTTETGTDYAVAKALGMTQSNLKPVLQGKAYLGDKAQRHAAKLLGIAFDDINALVNEDKAKSEADRAYWRSVCTEGVRQAIDAAGKAAAAFIIGTGLIGLAPRAQAESVVQPLLLKAEYPAGSTGYACYKTIHYAHRSMELRRCVTGCVDSQKNLGFASLQPARTAHARP